MLIVLRGKFDVDITPSAKASFAPWHFPNHPRHTVLCWFWREYEFRRWANPFLLITTCTWNCCVNATVAAKLTTCRLAANWHWHFLPGGWRGREAFSSVRNASLGLLHRLPVSRRNWRRCHRARITPAFYSAQSVAWRNDAANTKQLSSA